ncbi:ATP-binding protein [Xylophilus sp. GOD-11R]|uniref:ATP-binding protein n=1 Tax=Xylophilus sp. GOD-11R TaxID=3089814 RepID=UPI00298CB0F4|nr:ATP-binding protein [Xylophilus sp. GOD-11R]WPB59003.1 ATP-binding protein [Xylophilus sp. GOD-11R]
MTSPSPCPSPPVRLSFLEGGGEVGDLLLRKDWRGHALGDPGTWPSTLRTMVGACLHSPVLGAVLWGPELRMLYNDAYVLSMGERHPSALGEPVAQVWGAAWNAVAADFLQVVVTGQGMAQRGVCLPVERHGRVESSWWDFTATPIFDDDGSVVGLFNQGTEITSQILAERARDAVEVELRALTAQLAHSVEDRTRDRNALWTLSSDLMLRCGFDGRIVAVNPAWTEMLGWHERELLGLSLLELLHPEDVDTTAQAAAASAGGAALNHFINRYRHRDGSYRWISWSTRPADGLINAVGRDVTEDRARAEALQASQEQLRQSQKLEALGQLTGGIAHDFNNLLTIVSTSIQLLQRPNLAEDRRQRFMGAISSAVTRASRLTGQLLAFARRQSLQPVVFDVGANVQGVVDMVRTLAGPRIALHTATHGDDCLVNADPGHFDTAIVNLCANARDAMQGTGRLDIVTSRVAGIPAHRDQPAKAGDFVSLAVTDTGCGIAPDLMDRVFEPFFTTKAVGQGTGLGLSQVFGFARQSGGDVHIRSDVGQGTTFTLYLPLAGKAAVQGSAASDRSALDETQAGDLLLVEDNAEVAAAVQESLRELGYRVTWAGDAEQALEILAREAGRFMVVFSDVVMPGIDGVDLAREIRRRYPALPVLLSSGYSRVLSRSVNIEFPLLAKPYSLVALASGLRDAIARRQAEVRHTGPSGFSTAADIEQARLTDLESLAVLDTPTEPSYDNLTRLAATLFDAPIALVSLIDADRQWFKSHLGLDATETPREYAFCAHAIESPGEVMVVPDATLDPRFAANPLVTGDPNIRFYAGAPLVTSWGHAIGTLCVIDSQPREAQDRHLEALKLLAAQVVERLEADRPRDAAIPKPPARR